MKRILVLQHESYDALGTWGPILKGSGKRIRFVNFERTPDADPSIEGYDGIILLGGYMGVYESDSYAHLKVELKLIENALKREIPIVGICLGSQILASVLGASVRKHTEREMGWCEVELTDEGTTDPVVGHFARKERVFQSHGDIFEIPKTARHLARSRICEGQAFRYGENAYGLQFHLEVNLPIIDDWFDMPENQQFFSDEAVPGSGKVSPSAIRADTDRYLDRSVQLSQETFQRFLKTAGSDPADSKPMRLGSGHREGE